MKDKERGTGEGEVKAKRLRDNIRRMDLTGSIAIPNRHANEIASHIHVSPLVSSPTLRFYKN